MIKPSVSRNTVKQSLHTHSREQPRQTKDVNLDQIHFTTVRLTLLSVSESPTSSLRLQVRLTHCWNTGKENTGPSTEQVSLLAALNTTGVLITYRLAGQHAPHSLNAARHTSQADLKWRMCTLRTSTTTSFNKLSSRYGEVTKCYPT